MKSSIISKQSTELFYYLRKHFNHNNLYSLFKYIISKNHEANHRNDFLYLSMIIFIRIADIVKFNLTFYYYK